MNEKHKEVCRAFNYLEYFLIFVSVVSGRVSISAFASLVGVPAGNVSSAARLKICEITAGFKKCTSVIKKKRKKHGDIVLLDLIDSYINHNEFVSVNNA